jgi:hypothetical protein
MKPTIVKNIGLASLLLLPLSGSGAVLGTRQRTITPTLITNVPGIFASDLANYAANGYSSWTNGPGSTSGSEQSFCTVRRGEAGRKAET